MYVEKDLSLTLIICICNSVLYYKFFHLSYLSASRFNFTFKHVEKKFTSSSLAVDYLWAWST